MIQIGSVGICGSDVHYYQHGRIAEYVVREPLVLGHEAGGRIVAVGAGVDPARIGERVALEPGVPCRVCRECKAGRYNLCRDVRFFATPPIDGTFAEYVALEADFAHPIPDSLSDDAAGLIEPLSVAVWACAKAGVGAGSRVLISGAGPIGIMNVQVARALGATEVVVSDVAPARLAAARTFGATRTLDARTENAVDAGIEVDAYIDCSGAPPAINAGHPSVATRPAVSSWSGWAPTRSPSLSDDPGPGTDHHRNIPLRQHLSHRHCPGRQRARSTSTGWSPPSTPWTRPKPRSARTATPPR